MSLDQLETVTIAPAPSIRGLLSDPVNVALSGQLDIAVKDANPVSETRLIWQQQGNKGWDMPEATVVTRQVPSGVGDVQTVIRPKARRFTMKLSALVGNDLEYNKLVNAVATGFPFTMRFTYDTTAGKSSRALPLCYYTGGLERMRYAGGRSTFNLKFYTEYPYFVSSTISTSSSFVATNLRGQDVMWGVAATSDTITTAEIVVKSGAAISGGAADPNAWVWRWAPPGETLSTGPFTGNPRGMIAVFSPPYEGTYGLLHGEPLGGFDISSGRTSGKAPPPLLSAGNNQVHVQPNTFRVFYWRDYAGI